MDIYDFLRSRDVSQHCRKINKTWNTCEMAIIISRSGRTLKEKHAAWNELIKKYPDMEAIKNMHHIEFESIHKKLTEIMDYDRYIMDYDRYIMERFYMPETGAVYKYSVWWNGESRGSEDIFPSFEKALSNVKDNWEHDEVTEIFIEKLFLANEEDEAASIGTTFDFDGNLYDLNAVCDEKTHKKWFPGVDYYEASNHMLCTCFYVDIPTPFERGDILVISDNITRFMQSHVFVLDFLSHNNPKWLGRALRGECADGSDLVGWGFFVSDNGILYGDHAMDHDCFEYYKGKLEDNNSLLHYVGLYLKDEIDLAALLNVQCRIVAEHQLKHDFLINSHGSYIPEHLLYEASLGCVEKNSN